VSNDTICPTGFVAYNGAVSGDASSWNWTFTGGSISSSTSSTPTVTYASPGTYNVQLIVSNTCSMTDTITGTIVVDACLSINEEDALTAVTAFVNGNVLNITFDGFENSLVKLQLRNALGQNVVSSQRNISAKQQTETVALNGLQSGIYFLTIENGNQVKTIKFFK
jgi:PKD repeat protein